MHYALKKTLAPDANERFLTRAELEQVIGDATLVALPRSQVNELMSLAAALGAAVSGSQPSTTTLVPSRTPAWLVPEAELPVCRFVVSRPEMEKAIRSAVASHGIAIIAAGTGLGKSTLARSVARALAQTVSIADLRDAPPDEALLRLSSLLGLVGLGASDAVVIEDLNCLDDPKVSLSLARVVSALRRRDRVGLLTCYRRPSARTLTELGLDATAVVGVPYLSETEVDEMVRQAGAQPSLWGRLAFFAAGCGHPQLVNAFVAGMSARNWPADAVDDVIVGGLTNADIEAARDAARRSLIGLLPAPTRSLLYRTSLVIGRFDRSLALDIGALTPNIPNAGDDLDQLVGPWIEVAAANLYRVSPLASSSGRESLTADEQTAVHNRIATKYLDRQTISASEANVVFAHALLGKAIQPLLAISSSVVTSDENTLRALSDELFLLRAARTDSPIYVGSPPVSQMLRLAQFKLVAIKGDSAAIAACAAALLAESTKDAGGLLGQLSEYIALATILSTAGISNHLTNWLKLLVRFVEMTEANEQFRTHMTTFENSPELGGLTLYGFLFAIGSMQLSSVARLEAIFDSVDALDGKTRDALLAGYRRLPSDCGLLVNGPWVAEQDRGEIDWKDVADRYIRMARKAESWGHPLLAVHCHSARVVMFDEYGGDPEAALAAAEAAVAELGTHVVLSRARAKVLWRRKDHQGSVSILRQIAGEIGRDDPIERAFALREAAISAAEIKDYQLAEEWFSEAGTAAETAWLDDMKPLAVGLAFDAAVAMFNAGRVKPAIERMAASLTKRSGQKDCRNLGTEIGQMQTTIASPAALWISRLGFPLKYGSVAMVVTETTRMTLGVPISPHLFRNAAATSAALHASKSPHLATALLAHTDEKTTEAHYIRASSLSVARDFAELIGDLRTP